MDSETAQAIVTVAGVSQKGRRLGRWLAWEEARTLLQAPNPHSIRGMRDRAARSAGDVRVAPRGIVADELRASDDARRPLGISGFPGEGKQRKIIHEKDELHAQQRTITEALDSWITNTESHVVPIADVIPEDNYSFAPAQTSGEFKGVRTFAQQLKHLAANNYRMAALILAEKPTADMGNETGPDSARTKAEIMEYLIGSFAALHKSVATIDEQSLVQPTTSPSQWQKTRLSFAVDAVAHCFDHYGQLVEYLRMNSIIPPDSGPKKP